MRQELRLTRRGFATAVTASAALAILGCGKRAQSQAPARAESAAAPAAAPAGVGPMIVYRDPNCPCCEKWAAMAEDAGYRVRVVDHPDMPAIKARYGVPEALASCHTAIVGDYAFEGHVPFEHVAQVLRARPEGVLGLAVAGMPAGSPGMEVPSGAMEEFEVMAFARDGSAKPFRV